MSEFQFTTLVQPPGPCASCGREVDERRFNVCWDCACSGEERAAKRTSWQHVHTGLWHVWTRQWLYAKFDLTWAWQRLTRTGDYRTGGTFDRAGYAWRRP